MSTAESCTGGNISHLITSVAGSSTFYKGSIISYDDELKKNILNVSDDTISRYGAVSEETVREMLSGVLKITTTDYALAVSGIMGPGGGTELKPVGTVWIAVGGLVNGIIDIEVKKYNFRFDRARNIEMTSLTALNLLRKFILSHKSNDKHR
jgi:nicotinamide-nucleotide amidase